MMRLIFLVNGTAGKGLIERIKLPPSAGYHIGQYGERNLYVVTASMEKRTIRSAITLADYRDQILAQEKNKSESKRLIKCLRDEASEVLCTKLYPRFLEFERGIRMAVTIALCADKNNFNNDVATSLEDLSLEKLGERLFTDHKFVKAVQKSADTNYIRKDILLGRLGEYREKTIWDGLFDDSLVSAKQSVDQIRSYRNAVMHFRTMSSSDYRKAYSLLGKVNRDVYNFINNSLNNVSYPSQKASGARETLLSLAQAYTDMYQDWQRTLAPLQEAIARNQAAYSRLAENMIPYRNSISKLQKTLSSSLPSFASSIQYPHFEVPEPALRTAQAMVNAAAHIQQASLSYDTQTVTEENQFSDENAYTTISDVCEGDI